MRTEWFREPIVKQSPEETTNHGNEPRCVLVKEVGKKSVVDKLRSCDHIGGATPPQPLLMHVHTHVIPHMLCPNRLRAVRCCHHVQVLLTNGGHLV